MNDDVERARAAEPAWDEVRERRVLSRVLGARDRARVRSRRVAIGVGLAVAAAVAIGIGTSGPWRSTPSAPVAAAPVPAHPDAGRLALHDGSVVELGEGARVQVVTDEAAEVRIAHEDGEARYVVSHVPARTFTVACADVEVIVRGTRFVVTRDGSIVGVEVEEGRVEVRRAGQSTLLVRGESLRIDGAARAEPLPPAAEPPPSEVAIAPAPAPARPSAPRAIPPPRVSVDALLAEADAARREHRPDDAVRALHAAIDALGDDGRAATPLFMLGRVERARGNASTAADAFAAAYERDPDAVLAEDALAESVVSLAAAGRVVEARAAAARYDARYPAGHYAERVHGALE